ncbi:protein SpAN-like [Aphidius gifuensis]|uniref:protein SpAN-like n=1 Tax=Aphidius gifuensis TaxID=684658 RepID=UPI001CDBF23B|nr:protein SpAN-like [Aphidius gifuensis]
MIVKLISFIWILINVVDTFPRKKYNSTVPSDPIAHSIQDPEVRPRFYQGDIAMTDEQYNYWRVGLRWDVFPNRMWENRTVPYVISDDYKCEEYMTILKAITYFNTLTCINFVPWDKVSKDYIIIKHAISDDGCWSYYGKIGGPQLVNLKPPDESGPNCLGDELVTIHELMHALGIFHEHARADRDNFVDIHRENIIPDKLDQFDKQSLENTTYSYEYDYLSIMHYENNYFSIDPKIKPSITPKIPGTIIGQRQKVTVTDCLKVNKLYGCLDDPCEAKQWLMKSRQDPEVSPGLYQGDIIMTNKQYNDWRIGLRWDVFPGRMWKNRTVPYVISRLYKTAENITIHKAITLLNNLTCINFVPWNKRAKDYIFISPTGKGCRSFIGKIGGPQLVILEPPDNIKRKCFGNEYRTVHELMHSLGIFHEQARADRDNFVDIHYENIVPRELVNFRKESLENTTYSYEYDHRSIMHYGSFFFSKDPKTKPTITSKIPGVILGQREYMTKTDCLKVNKLYGCLDDPSEAKKWNDICSTLEI